VTAYGITELPLHRCALILDALAVVGRQSGSPGTPLLAL
jgi:hypothetical protein